MARKLQQRDIDILLVLAPELGELVCSGSGHEFQSVIPPVSNHIAADEDDFRERLRRLSPEDLEYLADRILDGSESLGCVPEEDVESLAGLIAERVSTDTARRIETLYRLSAAGLM